MRALRIYGVVFLIIFFIASLLCLLYHLFGWKNDVWDAERIIGVILLSALAIFSGFALLHDLRNNPYSRSRRAILARWAAQMGMEFEERAKGFQETVRSVSLWNRVADVEALNVMRRQTPECEIAVFDYIAEGIGDDPEYETGTAIRLASEKIQFPSFTLSGEGRPREFLKPRRGRKMSLWKSRVLKVFSTLGNLNLIFMEENDPEFADSCILTGPDEERIRALFSLPLRSFFLKLLRRGYSITIGTSAGQLTVGGSKMIPSYRLKEYLDIAKEILDALNQAEQYSTR